MAREMKNLRGCKRPTRRDSGEVSALRELCINQSSQLPKGNSTHNHIEWLVHGKGNVSKFRLPSADNDATTPTIESSGTVKLTAMPSACSRPCRHRQAQQEQQWQVLDQLARQKLQQERANEPHQHQQQRPAHERDLLKKATPSTNRHPRETTKTTNTISTTRSNTIGAPNLSHRASPSCSSSQAQQAASQSSPSTNSFITTLVYQIVIISLILHELPTLSRGPSVASGGSLLLLAEASKIHSYAGRQQNNNDQEQIHAAPRTPLANDQLHDDERDWPVNGRHKRHLSASALPQAEHTSHRFRRQQQQQQGKRVEVECNKLAAMWLFLHSSYPSLASHLLEWATQTGGKQSDEQFLWARSPQAARSLGHLLEEAERLVAASGRSSSSPHTKHQLQAAQQQQLAGAAWLARVSSNPAYAKLVQHFLAKQRHQASLGPHHSPATSSSVSGKAEEARDEEQMAAAASAPAIAATAAASAGQQHHDEQDPSAYGKVAHYPREIGNTDNSKGMARFTIDKLHRIEHHNRQLEHQMQLQDQQSPASGGAGDNEETNRIPQMAADVEQMTEGEWRKLSESATNAARQNFVYGEVLLSPSQLDQQGRQILRQRQKDPLNALREYNREQDRQRLMALSNNDNRQHQPASVELASKATTSQDSHPPRETFGRVLNGPLNMNDFNNHNGNTNNNNNNDKSAHHLNRQAQPTGQDLRASPSSSLATGTSGPTSNAMEFSVRGASEFGQQQAGDELASQQGFQQVAMNDGSEIGAPSSSDEEFVGEFHAGPVKPEVRQLRSLDQQRQAASATATTTTTTTSDSNKHSQQPETTKNNNVFIVD